MKHSKAETIYVFVIGIICLFIIGASIARGTASVDYSGSADNVIKSTTPITTTTGTRTILVWGYLYDTSEAGCFFGIGAEAGNKGYVLCVGSGTANSAGNEFVAVYPGVNWRDYNMNIGTGWHFLGETDDGTTVRGLVDCVLSASTYVQDPLAPTDLTEINNQLNDTYSLNGRTGPIYVYNRELSTQEICDQMHSYWPIDTVSLVGFFPMDEGVSTSTYQDPTQSSSVQLTESGTINNLQGPPITMGD